MTEFDGEPKPTNSLFYLLTTSALQILDEAVCALMPLDSRAAALPVDSHAVALLPVNSRAAALLPLLHTICFLLLSCILSCSSFWLAPESYGTMHALHCTQ